MPASAGMTWAVCFPIVTLNLFQGPLGGLGLASRWMLKQVQHDGDRDGAQTHVSHGLRRKRGDRRGSATCSAAGMVHGLPWGLRPRDACLQPSYAQASGQKGGRGIWAG